MCRAAFEHGGGCYPRCAHLWAAVFASSTPPPCIQLRTAFMPPSGSSFRLLPLRWMLSGIPNIKEGGWRCRRVLVCLPFLGCALVLLLILRSPGCALRWRTGALIVRAFARVFVEIVLGASLKTEWIPNHTKIQQRWSLCWSRASRRLHGGEQGSARARRVWRSWCCVGDPRVTLSHRGAQPEKRTKSSVTRIRWHRQRTLFCDSPLSPPLAGSSGPCGLLLLLLFRDGRTDRAAPLPRDASRSSRATPLPLRGEKL